MRIIIELTPEEAKARDAWQHMDGNDDDIDVYDARWQRLAKEAFEAAQRIASEVDFRSTMKGVFRDDEPPALRCTRVDLAYHEDAPASFGSRYRYTLAGDELPGRRRTARR
jgi:hypothetical protein